ncbi:hypothetical protein ALNOE001_11340 [Candidatus Methanobinarius endosymbioticus]|uniref:Uncharacterized protein n=1 Tax=Candidatus Methanobinarius endosymbioticus TaxID=2006182 RepID=A0A366MAB9_9EURY|nr:hypothetical protein ALNOE001_11340 [Candidatus Methanobinarius endosymbioticus]
MKCRNCGNENPSDSKYCTNYGFDLEKQNGMPVKEKNNTSLIIGIGLIIIIVLIVILGIGIYELVNDQNNENNHTPIIVNVNNSENSESQNSVSGSLHKVRSYNGVFNDSISILTKGSKFKDFNTNAYKKLCYQLQVY